MESPLEVLSRAATMVQDNSADTRLTSKELPTAKWRRDRRIRVSSEYHSPPSPVIKPLSESNSSNNGETPLDMSVSSKPRSPPPPYREPLPGSTYATALARPSVITQAPKREMQTNRDSKDAVVAESISMIDPVIDEHFRRSLGADYMNIFGNKKTTINNTTPNTNTMTTTPTTPSPPLSNNIKKPVQSSKTTITTTIEPDTVAMSVDDHFAKALGNDTWKQLQAADSRNDSNNKQSQQQQDQTASVNNNRSKGKN